MFPSPHSLDVQSGCFTTAIQSTCSLSKLHVLQVCTARCGPVSRRSQSVWDLWWTKCHWDSFFRVFRFSPVIMIPPLLLIAHVSSGGWAMGPLAARFHRNVVWAGHCNNRHNDHVTNIKPQVTVFRNWAGGTARRFRCAFLLLRLSLFTFLVAKPQNILTESEQCKSWNVSFCSFLVTVSKVNSCGLNRLGLILDRIIFYATTSAHLSSHWVLTLS